jgi:SAM-dependent methyltransferase
MVQPIEIPTHESAADMKHEGEKGESHRGWLYAQIGDYHRNLDPNWSYTPTYLAKMAFVKQRVRLLPKAYRILDAGCGEGVLVEQFSKEGFQIEGLDLNYQSEHVQRGSILNLPFGEGRFDVVLLLDVLEHIAFEDQPRALQQVRRVLKSGGLLIASIANLAHCNSRLRMALLGRLDRTDQETEHVGERPFPENRELLVRAGLRILEIKGVTLTVPLLYRGVICRWPAKFRWLHDLLQPLAFPSFAMLNIFVCMKGCHHVNPSGTERGECGTC